MKHNLVTSKKVVYIAHPLGGGPDREQNRRNASQWVAWAARRGVAPIADWIILSGEFDECPENRALGLSIDLALIERCQELWLVGGRISPGMAIERDHAIAMGVRVLDFTKTLGLLPADEKVTFFNEPSQPPPGGPSVWLWDDSLGMAGCWVDPVTREPARQLMKVRS